MEKAKRKKLTVYEHKSMPGLEKIIMLITILDQNLCSKEGRVNFSSKTKSLAVTLQKQQISILK